MPRILYCRCAFAKVVPDDAKDEVLRQLCDSNLPFETVSDLCEMSARQDAQLKEFADAAGEEPLKIAACEPRAVKWLFHAAGAPLPPEESVDIFNMRDQPVDELADKLLDNA